MEMYSVGRAGVKMIRGVTSGRYLAMNKYGNVYTTVRNNTKQILHDVETLTFKVLVMEVYSKLMSQFITNWFRFVMIYRLILIISV